MSAILLFCIMNYAYACFYSTGQMTNLFANMEFRNDSSSSLSHDLNDSRNIPTQDMPISRSSELALALRPVNTYPDVYVFCYLLT